MSVEQLARVEEIVARWRCADGPDNPAGPLWASGAWAEAEIVEEAAEFTLKCATACTGSTTRYCC